MLYFIIGLFVGSFIGVFYMCLLQASHDDQEE